MCIRILFLCYKRSDVDEVTKVNLISNMEEKIDREEAQKKGDVKRFLEKLKANGYNEDD